MSKTNESSRYPVKPGTVIRVLEPVERFNRKLGYRAPHTLYIWILRNGRFIESKRGKYLLVRMNRGGRTFMAREGRYRIIHVALLYVPNLVGAKDFHMLETRKLMKVCLCQNYLRHRHYEVIANLIFNYTDEAWLRFYRAVGVFKD